MVKRRCRNCGEQVLGLSEDWQQSAELTWCSICIPFLWEALPKDFTRQQYADTYEKVFPGEERAFDNLLMGINLAPQCRCNNCNRG